MSAQSVNGQKIIWPSAQSGLTEQEKSTLEGEIVRLRKGLLPVDGSFAYKQRGGSLSRRLYINKEYTFVVLNQHGGMPLFYKSGAQQKKIKYIWECNHGSFWIKKRVFSPTSFEFLRNLLLQPDVGHSSMGFTKIEIDYGSLFQKGKLRYFEEVADCSLLQAKEWFDSNSSYGSIYDLIDAVRKIHRYTATPAGMSYHGSSTSTMFGMPHRMFHGDISPNNVVCDAVKDEATGKLFPYYQLTDLTNLGNTKDVLYTRGWASPETIKYMNGSKEYGNNSEEFLVNYGAKKDIWALGLIVGSILRNAGPHTGNKQPLPFFSFILNRLKFDNEGYVVDESGIAEITQQDIDKKMKELIDQSANNDERKLLWFVKGCLRVDPNQRDSLENLCRIHFGNN